MYCIYPTVLYCKTMCCKTWNIQSTCIFLWQENVRVTIVLVLRFIQNGHSLLGKGKELRLSLLGYILFLRAFSIVAFLHVVTVPDIIWFTYYHCTSFDYSVLCEWSTLYMYIECTSQYYTIAVRIHQLTITLLKY